MKVLKKICIAIVRALCFLAAKIIYRVKIEGLENVPKDKACIICGNHVHALDAPALMAVVDRNINFMAKEELWKSTGFRFMAMCYKVFPVKRGKNDLDAVKAALTILKKNGAVNIAIRAGVPIVPFAVIGDFKPFKKIIYRFGEPMDFSEYKDKAKEKEVVDSLTKQVMDNVIALRDGKELTTK